MVSRAFATSPTLTALLADRGRIDPAGMMERVAGFPEQCREAWERSARWTLPRQRPQRLVVMGMGGSAIGADLLAAYLQPHLPIPMAVCREYEVPGWVDSDTLAVAMSYSGNTEETLSAYQDAKRRGACRLAFSTGGSLAERCREDGVACHPLPPGLPPRTSLPYSFFSLLRLMEALDLWHESDASFEDLQATLSALRDTCRPESGAEHNVALQLAWRLREGIPVVYGAGPGLATVAYRWKCQINENAKLAAFCAALPEANHNESAGWSSPQPATDYARLIAVFLRDERASPGLNLRADITAEYLESRLPVHSAQARGSERLARLFSLVLLGDFVSVYLAWLRGLDPTPVDAIEWLKGELARRRG